MVRLGDILPLIYENDVRILKEHAQGYDEICLLRGDYISDSLSEILLNAVVTKITNLEEIIDTVNIYIEGGGK